jgi:hypothetical protein
MILIREFLFLHLVRDPFIFQQIFNRMIYFSQDLNPQFFSSDQFYWKFSSLPTSKIDEYDKWQASLE